MDLSEELKLVRSNLIFRREPAGGVAEWGWGPEASAGPTLTPKNQGKLLTLDITDQECIYEINRFF